MAIWLPCLAIDRWRHSERCKAGEGADAAPLALIAETAHGPRIEAVNAAALAVGIRLGMLLADARSIHPRLAVRPADPEGDRAFLERLALWAQRWGPWSGMDAPDGLLVDVTAVAHLFGGEAAMLEEAQACMAARGLAARVAIAPTAGAAWALVHCARRRPILRSGEEALLDPLPVAGLRLAPEVLLVLRRLGLKRIGDLRGIGRDALQRRFRNRRDPAANPLIRLDQLLGLAAEPLLPVVAEEVPLAQRRLLEPIRHRELLDVVVADLAGDMARLLEGRGSGARRLELGLWRVDGDVAVRPLEFAAATRDPAHIARLFAAKLDDLDAGFGIELVRLRAPWCEALTIEQTDIETVETEGTTLAACIDRLTVRLGEAAVRRPVSHPSHIPERAQRWRPPLEVRASQEELAFNDRPLKLLDKPEEIAVLYATPDGTPQRFRWRGAVHDIVRAEGPERIAPEWWRERSTVRLRDYYRIEDDEGRRYWIWRHGLFGDGRGGDPQWFLQGLFA
ncbi:MAG: DNA polymerase Y family protein [Novosphingobium sp.]|nr:DNA polymerase Y family protein [Novosphingobium sp.]MBO9602996.1 DNA polymerase Y family protein [Novosphingobium sp.]